MCALLSPDVFTALPNIVCACVCMCVTACNAVGRMDGRCLVHSPLVLEWITFALLVPLIRTG